MIVMSDVYKLPVSSYDELIKIIKVYGNGKVGVPLSLDDLVKSSGMSKTIISKNNGFLVQIGLITEGNKKSPSELCKRLANAYNMNLREQIVILWSEIINQDEFISKMISVIGIKGKLSKNEYINHIVYSSNCGNGAGYKAGAAAIIEILKIINIISENDGNVVIGDTDISNNIEKTSEINKDQMDINMNKVRGEALPVPLESVDTTFFVQQYTCESGKIAKFIIPEDATEDDLLGFRDILNIALKRKFKLKIDN